MKVCGFIIVRNAILFDYPVVEAISSILPLCDEVVVAVGKSDDDTLNMVRQIHPEKVRIIETVWDDSQRRGGRVLAMETDKAFAAISHEFDWCIYIQADEVMHEKDYAVIKEAMRQYLDDPGVEGLLFQYRHFYGSYDFVGTPGKWYRNEVRIIRNDKNIFSYQDAQGFRKRPSEKLRVKPIDSFIYHYGWVRDPRVMQNKVARFHRLWHDDLWLKRNIGSEKEFDYSQIGSLEHFDGTHPQVMMSRMARLNWKFEYDVSRSRLSFSQKVKRWISQLAGYPVGEHRNYRII